MNKEPIRAEYGKPMDLMSYIGRPYQWDGEKLTDLRGSKKMHVNKDWSNIELYTRPEGVPVLPPLAKDELEPIEAEVGMEVEVYKVAKKYGPPLRRKKVMSGRIAEALFDQGVDVHFGKFRIHIVADSNFGEAAESLWLYWPHGCAAWEDGGRYDYEVVAKNGIKAAPPKVPEIEDHSHKGPIEAEIGMKVNRRECGRCPYINRIDGNRLHIFGAGSGGGHGYWLRWTGEGWEIEATGKTGTLVSINSRPVVLPSHNSPNSKGIPDGCSESEPTTEAAKERAGEEYPLGALEAIKALLDGKRINANWWSNDMLLRINSEGLIVNQDGVPVGQTLKDRHGAEMFINGRYRIAKEAGDE